MIHRHRETPCPACGHPLDASAEVGGNAPPGPGDVTLCGECGTALVFADDLTLRRPTPVEWDRMIQSPGFAAAVAMYARLNG